MPVGGGGRKSEHDPEKWTPVFGKDHAPAISGTTIRR
jgi:hypothetical protein